MHLKHPNELAKSLYAAAHPEKVHRVMSEFKHGDLHSGSPSGPTVTSRPQAVAIGLSEARKAGEHVPPK